LPKPAPSVKARQCTCSSNGKNDTMLGKEAARCAGTFFRLSGRTICDKGPKTVGEE